MIATNWSFGHWVKQRRRSLDITLEGLAELIGCSVVLVSKIEGDARRRSLESAALRTQQLVSSVIRRLR